LPQVCVVARVGVCLGRSNKFVMAVALVGEVLAAIDEEVFSLEHMIVRRGSYDEGGDSSDQFDQYVSLMAEMKKSSELSKTALEIIFQDGEKLKFANTRLSDYGDLMKRLERLNSAVDELEYKVLCLR
jgi:hypothetical protein